VCPCIIGITKLKEQRWIYQLHGVHAMLHESPLTGSKVIMRYEHRHVLYILINHNAWPFFGANSNGNTESRVN
jgi:hypothetical protein